MPNIVRTETEGLNFIHKELWQVVKRQLDHAATNVQGSLYDHLASMVFAFHTLEAYINFAGELLAPAIWADERNFFRNEPYRGAEGKIKKVIELSGLAAPDPNGRPYSTVLELKTLRDRIAHARPERISEVTRHTVYDAPPMHFMPFEGVVTLEKAQIAAQDIEAFIESIHAAPNMQACLGEHHLGRDALDGIRGHSISHSVMFESYSTE